MTAFLGEAQGEIAAIEFFRGLGYPPDLQDKAVKTVLPEGVRKERMASENQGPGSRRRSRTCRSAR